MTEHSENEASKTGQNSEVPESEGTTETVQTGYRESEEHIPDPTAMSGTLETSGTGGGHNERLTGTTRVFGDVEEITRRVESLVADRIQSISEEVRAMLLQHEASAQAVNIPQQTVEEEGLPTHQGNIISPEDNSGAAKDADRSGNVGGSTGPGSPDDVSGEHSQVEPTQSEAYVQRVIAGAKGNGDGARQHPEDEETEVKEEEAESKDEKPSTTPAKKTASPRRNNNKK